MIPTRRHALAALLVVAAVAACADPGRPSPPSSAERSAEPSAASEPSPAASPARSGGATLPPLLTAPPNPSPTPAPVATPASSDEPDGVAAACSGTAANRDFYAAVAAAVSWTVYCPVLPDGWFVETGEYRLAGGGHLAIDYRGPNGARLAVREGAFCSDGDACLPPGEVVGPAALGDREGELIASGDTFAVSVDTGARISWLATGSGFDEAAFRAIAAAFATVG